MSIPLQQDEQVFYPQPFLPGEAVDLMVSNKRLVRVTDAGIAEFPVGQIDFVGRTRRRPLVILGVILAVASVALLVFGIEEFVLAPGKLIPDGMPAIPIPGQPPVPEAAAKVAKTAGAVAKKKAAGDDPAGANEDEDSGEDASWFGLGRWGGGGMAGGGVVLLVAGLLLMTVKRYYVNCRMGTRFLEFRAKGKNDQTMLLATISSAMTVAKTGQQANQAAAPPPAAAMAPAQGPAVQVDDGGDPVKALQDLKAAKDAGKIDAATYAQKRAVLLDRVGSRR